MPQDGDNELLQDGLMPVNENTLSEVKDSAGAVMMSAADLDYL